MSNRFPPLAAPSPIALAATAPSPSLPAPPLWLRSFPQGEWLILAAVGLVYAIV